MGHGHIAVWSPRFFSTDERGARRKRGRRLSVLSRLAMAFASALGFCTCVNAAAADEGIQKIKHVVIVMQENRSFDSYFGTFPGADGIPMHDGAPAVCVPDPSSGQCVRPYHDTEDANAGGPHGAKAADRDIDGGKMDGFIRVMIGAKGLGGCPTDNPTCVAKGHEHAVMGYHTSAEIPNYWTYAKDFVLQDR